jgi:hypothetical protein
LRRSRDRRLCSRAFAADRALATVKQASHRVRRPTVGVPHSAQPRATRSAAAPFLAAGRPGGCVLLRRFRSVSRVRPEVSGWKICAATPAASARMSRPE